MQMNLKKLCPIFGIACMSLFSTASADVHKSPQTGSASSQGSQETTGQGTYQGGTCREITPNAGPRVTNGADVFITADFIYWKTVQEGTRYATTGIAPVANNPTFINVPRGHTRSVGRDWSPGFKVGLGLTFDHDGWDLNAQYTWLHAHNHSSVTQEIDPVTNFGVVSLQTPNTDNGPYGDEGGEDYRWDRALARWSLHFNVIDLELGRNFYLSQFLTMRPFIGLKGTWQDQDMRTRLFNSNGVDVGTSPNNPSGPYRIHQHNDVWGIGVRGGFNIAWYMSKNWSIYGDLAFTSMWADYTDLHRKDTVDNSDALLNGISPVLVNIKEDDHYSVKYIGELELGLRWDIWFSNDNYHFAIQAGWEQQVWINWNTFHDLQGTDNWNDLNFQGLNLKFRFDF